MKFTKSKALTFGMELEFQIVDQATGALSASSVAILDAITKRHDSNRFALEATLATIELNSSVHESADTMIEEVATLTADLRNCARLAGLDIRGGGTQYAQFWNERVMAPTARARDLEARFGFLPKRFSTYGMHVHVGVTGGNAAIKLANALQALSPLFIAMSVASPFLQRSDTSFCSVRPIEPLVYPYGGPMPNFKNWLTFEIALDDMLASGLATSIKDVYWDVRPKPEFGTVEVRVFDTPLSVYKAVGLAAFTRGCAALALRGELRFAKSRRPHRAELTSRFLACRDGLNASLFNPFEGCVMPAREWMESMFAAVLRAPLSAADATCIAELQLTCSGAQDSDVMRATWAEACETRTTSGDSMKESPVYSRLICERLLQKAV